VNFTFLAIHWGTFKSGNGLGLHLVYSLLGAEVQLGRGDAMDSGPSG